MAIKKREIYNILWKSCDELRGVVEPHKYKDYILTLLFLKYASDLKKKNPNSRTLQMAAGYSYDDLVATSTQQNLAQKINDAMKQFTDINPSYQGIVNIADFNQLGPENERNQTLSALLNLFTKLDFSHNHADDDDILGDAYEYLVRQFAIVSGKSKGQFYTPAEVSRILAKIIQIDQAQSNKVTVYDPACGSASLLIRAAEQSGRNISIYGQEISHETAALAIMNCFLHQKLDAEIWSNESTLSKPHFKDEKDHNKIKQFDYVVVNPPFSDKKWDKDVDKAHDPRFSQYELKSNGDYAWLLHVIHSMKDTGKAAIILPHGVLFRGGVEAQIRKDIIQKGLIQGIIGLPANLFYNTGIPACILMLDKSKAKDNKCIFFVDASRDYIKDGNKNRLREQDIAKITETFLNRKEIPHYSHLATLEEIEKNEFNLNIPRYVQPESDEPAQNLDAHIHGGIPTDEIDIFNKYWDVFPRLRKSLFKPIAGRKGFESCTVTPDELNDAILNAPGMRDLNTDVQTRFDAWRETAKSLIEPTFNGKGNAKNIQNELQHTLRESYKDAPLLNEYDVYQILMSYCAETMSDDLGALCMDGWKTARDIELEFTVTKSGKNKGQQKESGWDGALIPKSLLIATRYPEDSARHADMERACSAAAEELAQTIEELEDGDPRLDCLNDKDEYTKKAATAALKEAKTYHDKEAIKSIESLMKLAESASNKTAKELARELDTKARAVYPVLERDEVIELFYKKWFLELSARLGNLYKDVAHRFATSLSELVSRYQYTLAECQREVDELEKRVQKHLADMGI